MDPSGSLPDMEEALHKLVEDIRENFEDIGLYMFHHGIATTDTELVSPEGRPVENPDKDFRESLVSGDAAWTITAHFNIGNVAWTDRVLYPDTFEMETAIQAELPSEVDVYRNMIGEAKSEDGEFDPFKYFEMMDGEVDDDEDGSGS